MIKVLFLIHDLGQGGAEKVLVNLVNHMDVSKFDITVMSLFDVGVNKQFLAPHIHYKYCFKHMVRGNSHLMKLLSPKTLHKWLIRDKYDIEVSYLEGPSARVISGCPHEDTQLISWIHVEQHHIKKLAASFRSEAEARNCYNRFDQTVCVSQYVKEDFCRILDFQKPCTVLYNTVESEKILALAEQPAPALADDDILRLVAVGTLKESKGYMRLLEIVKRLRQENLRFRLYILGIGPLRETMEHFIANNALKDTVVLLGYDTNPYKYVSKCDLFVCASFAEGFSTAATEALIVGTSVCTVDVSGMKEMLGENNEYGVVTDNNEDALYLGLKQLIDNPKRLIHYRNQAKIRGKLFRTEDTVENVEKMLVQLAEN